MVGSYTTWSEYETLCCAISTSEQWQLYFQFQHRPMPSLVEVCSYTEECLTLINSVEKSNVLLAIEVSLSHGRLNSVKLLYRLECFETVVIMAAEYNQPHILRYFHSTHRTEYDKILPDSILQVRMRMAALSNLCDELNLEVNAADTSDNDDVSWELV